MDNDKCSCMVRKRPDPAVRKDCSLRLVAKLIIGAMIGAAGNPSAGGQPSVQLRTGELKL